MIAQRWGLDKQQEVATEAKKEAVRKKEEDELEAKRPAQEATGKREAGGPKMG